MGKEKRNGEILSANKNAKLQVRGFALSMQRELEKNTQFLIGLGLYKVQSTKVAMDGNN